MPPKTAKPKIQDIPWAEDNDRLVWAFITECEKDVNYKVLFGKKETTENTSGDTKTTVFKRIAQVILPELFAVDGTTVANRLKGQLERLTKTYRKQAARLRQTGGGLDGENDENSQDERLKYYIPGEGPNDSTPAEALNLWQQIEKDFKFFPHLHQIFASRPNVTPIVITTALGPHGRKTVWYQPPDDETTQAPTSGPPPPFTPIRSPSRAFGTDVTPAVVNQTTAAPISTPVPPTTFPDNSVAPPPSSSGQRAPKSSAISREAIEKARSYIEKVPQKRTLLDTLIEIQEKNTKMWSDEMKEKLLIQKRAHLLEEFKLGLVTKEEYLAKVSDLDGGGPPAKCQDTRQYSPDWEELDF